MRGGQAVAGRDVTSRCHGSRVFVCYHQYGRSTTYSPLGAFLPAFEFTGEQKSGRQKITCLEVVQIIVARTWSEV